MTALERELDSPDLIPEILLVDPDLNSRATVREMLGSAANVQGVATGDEAIKIANTREMAAIMIALSLPGLDAFQTVTQLRRIANTRNVPVLFLADAPLDWLSVRRGYALGALGYMTKPLDAHALRAKVDVLLTLFRRGVELRQREQMIAKQHEAIQEAQAALEQVTAANRAKDLYMGVLGHDLRNPLGAILMSARMMLMRDSLAPDDRQSVNRVARNAERMAALIRDILDYTRGQAAGGIPVSPRMTDMGDICAAMLDEVQLLHADRAIKLSTIGSLHGHWDRERVEQVVSNLLTNALTHSKSDIDLSVDGRDEGEVVVSLHNAGAIPQDQQATLFEPFRKGSGSKIGLGLGLYIVSEIMRAHGGAVEVTSTVRDGTTFTTRWPRASAISRGHQQ